MRLVPDTGLRTTYLLKRHVQGHAKRQLVSQRFQLIPVHSALGGSRGSALQSRSLEKNGLVNGTLRRKEALARASGGAGVCVCPRLSFGAERQKRAESRPR